MSSNSYEKRTGGPIHLRVPPDDNIERLTCNECGFTNYINPKVIVGAVCTWDNKFLLCKRAIEPRIGFGPCLQVSWKRMKQVWRGLNEKHGKRQERG